VQRTPSQIAASRRNGAKSHGPVTPEGKARVSQNGIKHGIYTQTVILENEDPDLYNSWRDEHLAEWAPATNTEHNLVIDIVDARWRLRRLAVLETKALDFEIGRMRPEIDEAFKEMDEGTRTVFGLTSLLSLNRTWEVVQTSIRSQHRIIDRATAQLLKLGKVRRTLDGSDDDCGGGDHGLAASLPAAAPDADNAQPAGATRMPASPVSPDSHLTGGDAAGVPEQVASKHPQHCAAAPPANSAEQTPAGAAAAQTAAEPRSATTRNRESKPEPVRTATPVYPRAVFDPTLDTRGRTRPNRLRAA
jgi:hypothetical protein